MNFFQHQDAAKKQSRKLVLFFLLAVAAVMVVLVIAVTLIYDLLFNESLLLFSNVSWYDYFFVYHKSTVIYVSVGSLLVIGGMSLYRTIRLASGGQAVAAMMDASAVTYSTQNPQEKVLMNIVDEMAIAAGISRPGVYIMPSESGMNAFAAGYSANSAIVCVTKGLLDKLSRDELQGVIGHEFSHILNGDMRMNIKMMGILSGIMVIGNLGSFFLRSTSFRGRAHYNGRGALGLFVIGGILVTIGYIGLLFGKLIRCALSRQREFLADASAVQFTRNPEGIAQALNKIRLASYGSYVNNAMAGEMSHFFFGDAVTLKINSAWLASHPPLEERIKRVAPGFDINAPMQEVIHLAGSESVTEQSNLETESKQGAGLASNKQNETVSAFSAESNTNFDSAHAVARGEALKYTGSFSSTHTNETYDFQTVDDFQQTNDKTAVHHQVNAKQIMDSVGTVSDKQVSYGQEIRQAMPDAIYQAMSTVSGACALVYCLLFDDNDNRREKQINFVSQSDSVLIAKQCYKLYPFILDLGPGFRFPLLELVSPVVRELEDEKRKSFLSVMRELIMFDGRVDLFEIIVLITVEADLRAGLLREPKIKFKSKKSVEKNFKLIFALFAHYGHNDKQEKSAAYKSTLEHAAYKKEEFPRLNAIKFSMIKKALLSLVHASPALKQNFLESCFHCAMFDGEIILQEYELLRMVAKILDCPIPPNVFLGAKAA